MLPFRRRFRLDHSELRASSLEWGQPARAAEDAETGVLRRLDGLCGHAYGHRRLVSSVSRVLRVLAGTLAAAAAFSC